MSLEQFVLYSAGGGFIGLAAGYFFKKILKIALFISGGIVLLLIALQHYKIISVNTDQLGNLSQQITNKTYEATAYLTTQHYDQSMIVTMPFFVMGFVYGFKKG